MLKKQAKTFSEQQIKIVMRYLESCPRNSLRNQAMFLLSLHGLRAKEIAELEVSMITDSDGQISDAIALQDKASNGNSGRIIPINKALKELLIKLLVEKQQSRYVFTTERSEKFSANAVTVFFKRLYSRIGCSSHSGRRTFITNCARKVSLVGGSIKDVMSLAGHRNLQTTRGT